MPDQDTEQEPSIEEILTSIRQIISDDDDDEGAEDAPESPPEPEEEVVELTEKIEDEPPEPEEEPEPEPEEQAIEVEMLDSEPEPVSEPEPEEQAAPEPEFEPEEEPVPVEDKTAADDDDSLLTEAAEDAAFEAFSELAKKTAVEHNGITIEEIVRSELRPLLKGWLDKHLPSIIERLVQEELDRVAKRAMEE